MNLLNRAVENSLRETVASLEAKAQQFEYLAQRAALRDPYYIAAEPESGATVGCETWDRFPPLWPAYEQAQAEADPGFRVITEEDYFRRAAQATAKTADQLAKIRGATS